MKKAYLSLGSNMGDTHLNLTTALSALEKVPGTVLGAVSTFYLTKPWGYEQQAFFTNICAEVSTTLSPEALLGACLGIEAAMGRKREFKNGPRIIDIDLLMYEGESRETEELMLPHPGMLERDFVLKPLLDIIENGTVFGMDIRSALDMLEK